jgi:hypothetical protein
MSALLHTRVVARACAAPAPGIENLRVDEAG